jgi:hypothetical protein
VGEGNTRIRLAADWFSLETFLKEEGRETPP